MRYISPLTKTLHFIFNVTGRCYNCSGTSHLAGQCPSSRRRAKRNRASKDIVVVHHNHYYQTRAGVNNPWGVPHRSINSSITQRGERLSVTTTTSTLTICRPNPIRPWPIHPTLPITTSTSITRPTRPPAPSSLSSLSHLPRFIYSPPTPHTGQISFTPSNTNPRHHLITMRFQMPCPSHIHHLHSLAIPIELPPPPRPLTTTTFTKKTAENKTKVPRHCKYCN